MDLTCVEDLLLTLLKYPLLGVQIIGYVPLTMTLQSPNQITTPSKLKSTPTKSLQFRFFTIPVLSQLFLITSFFLVLFLFVSVEQQRDEFNQYSKLSTDMIIISVMSMISLINAMGNRLYGFVTVRGTLTFWHVHCHQLEKISKIWTQQEVMDLYGKQVRVQFRWTVLFLLLPVCTMLSVDLIIAEVFGVSTNASVLKMLQDHDIGLMWGMIFWIYLTYSHTLLSNWVTGFVKIYNIVLACVIKEVETMTMKSDDFVTLNKIDEITQAYDVILGLVDYFNATLSVRLVGEVWINILWILGCIYMSLASYKMGEFGTMLTNLLASGMAMKTLYTYGNEGENLEQNRITLVKRLCNVKGNNLGHVGLEKVNQEIKKLLLHF
ncbi:hypothetical protein Fcan01_27031 [Folsomia candida]|uniref:Gustatory receptor n=1 Tax=Folsomia candida TaxID=158441 RepID=A0A226CZ65_FOLCA|nr:hypothetical protein Fcan01_27031 [Folsomia candida]